MIRSFVFLLALILTPAALAANPKVEFKTSLGTVVIVPLYRKTRRRPSTTSCNT